MMSSSYASIAGAQNTGHNAPAKAPLQQSGATGSVPAHPNNGQHPQADQRPPSTPKYQPDPAHIPKTGQDETSSYILTLHTTPEIYDAANALRRKYFPQRLNKTPAHITLFHALPGSKLDGIRTDLFQIAEAQSPFKLSTGSTKRLKRGVALLVKGTYPAKELQTQMKERWHDWLSQQDRGGFQGHYTVMNKVEDEEVIQTAIKEIDDDLRSVHGEAQGLTLWKYEKGHWRLPEKFTFSPQG